MLLNPFNLHTPQTLVEACHLQTQLKDSRWLAGGTFLLNSLKVLKRKGLKTPTHVISLRHIPELKGIQLAGTTLSIGALTTLHELYASPLLTDSFTIIKTACRHLATTPIRNMATLGGNLACRYTWTELPTVLIALDAKLHFADGKGGEEVLFAEDFFKSGARSEKILSRVTLPKESHVKAAYIRISRSPTIDLPLLAVCLKTSVPRGLLENVRVVINNTTVFAQRDERMEKFLTGKKLEPALADSLWSQRTEKIFETDDEYKTHMFQVALQTALKEIL